MRQALAHAFPYEDAKFGTTAINVGLICLGPAIPLARSLGRKKTLEMVLTGDMITAAEAERLGLINKVDIAEVLGTDVGLIRDNMLKIKNQNWSVAK